MSASAADRATLAGELARRVRGTVRADEAALALHATDASNYRHVPLAVVQPRDAEDVVAAVEACRDLGVPVLPRGAGTSLAGQCCNVAVVLDFTRHVNRVLEIDPESRTARVEPGCVLDVLQLAARPHGLRFGPDPSSHDRCTLGGMIANDACGARSLVHGRTSENVSSLDVVLQDGTRLEAARLGEEGLAAWAAETSRRGSLARDLRALRDAHAARIREGFPSLRRRVSGYDLPSLLPERGVDLARLLCGTEGTCAVTLAATVRLVEAPRATCLVVLGYPDVTAASEAVPRILEHAPRALEAVERALLEGAGRPAAVNLPAGDAWLYAEMAGASDSEARSRAEKLAAIAGVPHLIAAGAKEARALWSLREAGVGATSRLRGGTRTHPGWEDAAVPPERLPSYLRGFRALLARFGYEAALYGHFGEGCVHARIGFDLVTPKGIARFRAFLDEAAALVVEHEGSLSGEHGDGQARAALLGTMYGPELVRAFEDLKRAWDPAGLLNPGRIVRARGPEQDLRPSQLAAPAVASGLSFAREGGSLGDAALGCVGAGTCRRDAPGVMCPSFRATRDEAHSPRGRAHLLAEMLGGELKPRGFASREVAEALDLCLGCKACASECPAGVDVPAMKAAFLHEHHRTAPRPRIHALAHASRWLAAASVAPRLANLAVRLPGARALLERVAGISRRRPLPRLAPETFRRWWSARAAREGAGEPVVLFVDTFTNHLEPGIGQAAARVMESSGARVLAPALPCCGRPLMDAGLLDEARAQVERWLDAVPPGDAPVVGLEPACVSMLRDDALRLMPDDPRAAALARRVRFFAEWVADNAGRLRPLPPGTEVVMQPHCHERALGSPEAAADALRRLGAAVTLLDEGCCGMAGAFGYDATKRDLSLRIGELGVLPALRDARPGARVACDGFSCRRQAEDGAGRRGEHLAELLARPE